MRILKVLLPVFFITPFLSVSAQDMNSLLKEADNLEKQQKEVEAMEKYKQVLIDNPANVKSLVKLAELNVMQGNKQTEKSSRRLYFESGLSFAKRAYMADSNQAAANYAMAMASGKMTEIESENKKIVADVKDVKLYADKALAIDPNHAKANYTLGKWHYEMIVLSGVKKAAIKLMYGGLPEASIESAITYMEKCKSLEPYFAPNYLDLAKAYKEDRKPTQAIEVLSKLVRLPTRTSEDIIIKAEGAKLLESLQ